MKNRAWQIVLGVIWWGQLGTIAFAGTISLQIKTTIELNDELIWAKLEIINKGNEVAREVKPQLWIDNRPHPIRGIDQLFPGKSLKTEFRTNRHPFQEPGLYFLPIHLEYRDQTGSLFKLPYLLQMVHTEQKPAGLQWKMSPAILPTDDYIEVSLTNTDSQNKQVRLSKIMAMQFKIELPASPFELKGQESRTWKLNIKHDTIWPNTYVSYLIAEYSHEGQHYSQFTPLTMQVTPEAVRSLWFFGRSVMSLILIGLILIAIIGAAGPIVYKRLWQKHS